MRPILMSIALSALTGCTTFPDLEGTIDPALASKPYPALRPQAQIIAIADEVETPQEEIRDALLQASDGLGERAEAARQKRSDETASD